MCFNVGMSMDIDDVTQFIEDRVVIKPFAQDGWYFWVAEHDDGDMALTLANNFARDSRTFDFYAELDEWTYADGKTQSFMQVFAWPQDEDELSAALAKVAATGMAHEALEWLRVDDEMPHDPHTDGDVAVLF